MANESLRVLLRRLGCATAAAGTAALSDAQLLERFVARRDEAAFELLVWRHGTMVLNLCRRLLRHEQDAEDAFQTSFLILARKADSIGKQQACASWLYKVAYRVALEARARSAERAAREDGGTEELSASARTDDLWCDLRPVLDVELSRLPEKYRAAFVLCCLEGRTGAEAAEELRCPKGTVLSRLARARERLRRGLLRRGICLPVSVLAATLAAHGQAADITAGLVTRTAQAALAGATVASACAAALTEGVLRAMFLSKVKTALGILSLVGMVGFAAAVVGGALLADPAEPGLQESLAQSPPKTGGDVQARERPDPDDGMTAAERRLLSQRKLTQIGVALHRYAETYQRLPAPAIYEGYPDGLLPEVTTGNVPAGGSAGGPAGGDAPLPGAGGTGSGSGAPPGRPSAAIAASARPLLSWRVTILPFLGESDLYNQFKRNEPWDSPHNRKLLAKMPAVYAAPGIKSGDRTYYQAIVGTGSSWEPRRQLRFPASIPDGTSNTILVVEAANPVPWSKPEDLPFVADQALPKFGGLFGGDFNALFADGAVQFLSAKSDAQVLRFAIMPADGQPIDIDKLLVNAAEGAADQSDPGTLRRENEQLRAALDALRRMADKEKETISRLRARMADGPPRLDAATSKLVEENARLQQALDRAVDEVDKLKAEKRRLEDEVQRQTKAVK
jgi:RNA polymerase sigma factor (sigma-70 family)